MKKIIILLLCLCPVFINTLNAQTEKDLNQLIKLDSVAYSSFTISSSKQIPSTISIKTFGSIEYFTKCLNGSVAVIPLNEVEIKNSNALFKKYSDLNITYNKDPKSQWQLVILLYGSTGADMGGSIWKNISYCKDTTELKAGGGIRVGNCNNVKALAQGKIFVLNTKDKLLLYSKEIYASGSNIESTIKEFTSVANSTFTLWSKQ